MQKRLYQITHRTTGTKRLIEAISPAQAIRHASNGMFEIKPANARDVADLMTAGVKMEQAGESGAAE